MHSSNLGTTWRRVVSFTVPHRETAPVPDWIGGWVGPRDGLGAQPHFPGRTFRSPVSVPTERVRENAGREAR
jgi:hypothetical protein